MISITYKENCNGCNGCYNVCPQNCISMITDKEGFSYPEVDKYKCIECGLCEKVCPIINKKEVINKPKVYGCLNKNEEIRKKSSSGGVFYLLAKLVICDGGVVFGAAFNSDFNVYHGYTEKEKDIAKFMGSKYVQSEIGITFKKAKEFLLKGRKVLFSGTPCQIAGLKNYLQKDYKNLVCIDLVCHGVPSPKVWRKYMEHQKKRFNSDFEYINFKSKKESWRRYQLNFKFSNGKTYKNTVDKDNYMNLFLKNISLRPSCYDCKFKSLHRYSDITLADFWGIENVLPELDDDKGTSLILINSDKGQLLLNNIKDKIICEEIPIKKAIVYNTAAIESVVKPKNREDFFGELDNLEFDKMAYKYCIKPSLFSRMEGKAKGILIKIAIKIGLKNSI